MTKTLTREEILRLQKKQASTVGSSGSSGGGITQAQLDAALARKVDVDFFAQLFEVYDGFDPATATKIETNATMPTSTTSVNIKALFGFWSQSFVSALGISPGGGGGGGGASYLGDLEDVTLSSPSTGQALVYRNGQWVNAAVNISDIGGISISNPAAGQSIVYRNGQWINEAINVGVTNISTGTGLSGGPITGTGTISIDNTYLTRISHGESAYNWGDHADAGYLKTSTFEATTWWGQSPSNGAVIGSLTNVDNITMNGNISMGNNKRIYFKNTSGNGLSAILMDTSNNFVIGEGMSSYNTYLRGSSLTFQTGSSHTDRMTIDTNGRVYVVNGEQGLRIGDALLSWDSSNQCLKISNAANSANKMSVFATGGVSSLGTSST